MISRIYDYLRVKGKLFSTRLKREDNYRHGGSHICAHGWPKQIQILDDI